MKSEFVIEFESAEEMKEFIAKINPVIKIAYSESKEIEEFRQKLLSLQSENNLLHMQNHQNLTRKNTPEAQAATFTPQEKYEKKSGKPKTDFGMRLCEFHGCGEVFVKTHNRMRFCPEHRSKKVKNPQSKSD